MPRRGVGRQKVVGVGFAQRQLLLVLFLSRRAAHMRWNYARNGEFCISAGGMGSMAISVVMVTEDGLLLALVECSNRIR